MAIRWQCPCSFLPFFTSLRAVPSIVKYRYFNRRGCGLVFRKNRFGDYVLTREARLAPGATILVYRDKATVQVYSRRSITGPSKVCVLQVLTKTLQLTKLYQKSSGTSHKSVVSEFFTYFDLRQHFCRKPCQPYVKVPPTSY